MAAGEWVQQLTSSRTSTPLVQAAARRAESMTGQNLPRDRTANWMIDWLTGGGHHRSNQTWSHLTGLEYCDSGRKSMTEIKTNLRASWMTDRMAARSSVRPRVEIWGGALCRQHQGQIREEGVGWWVKWNLILRPRQDRQNQFNDRSYIKKFL